MSGVTIDLAGLRRLIAAGAQLVEVLQSEEYAELRLRPDGTLHGVLRRDDIPH